MTVWVEEASYKVAASGKHLTVLPAAREALSEIGLAREIQGMMMGFEGKTDEMKR